MGFADSTGGLDGRRYRQRASNQFGGSTPRGTRLLPVLEVVSSGAGNDHGAAQLYENVETGHQSSACDLIISARHAELVKDAEEGLEDAVHFNGEVCMLVDA